MVNLNTPLYEVITVVKPTFYKIMFTSIGLLVVGGFIGCYSVRD